MSYSFTVKGRTVAKALENAAAAFDKMAETQTIHKRDRDAHLANVSNLGNLLGAKRDDQVVVIAMNGSLGWSGSFDEKAPENVLITSSSGSASVYYTDENATFLKDVQGEL
jgi:hypothetical protein